MEHRPISFPDDHLTPEEMEKMSGGLKVYKLKEPMRLAAFREMPQDLQKRYIKHLMTEYNANDSALAFMFGVTRSTASHVRARLGIRSKGREESKMSPYERTRWRGFINRLNEAEPRKFGEWVPESDPPREDGVYLVFAEDGRQYVESYGDIFDKGERVWTRRGVRYWMPLPADPKEGKRHANR